MKMANFFKKFQKGKTLEDFFIDFSIFVSEELLLSKKRPKSAKTGEESLTEKLVKDLLKLANNNPVPLRIFNAQNERANGNDLEIVLPTNTGKYIIFPCQAKKLYNNGKYYAINHKTKDGTPQITTLTTYAKKVKGFPLYLLYNRIPNTFIPINQKYSPKSYGCSLINAYFLLTHFFDENKKSLKRTNFAQVHPPAQPLPILADLSKTNFIQSLLEVFGKFNYDKYLSSIQIKQYEKYELEKMDFWEELLPDADNPPTRFVLTSKEKLFKYFSSENPQPFNPKYRIMFTPEVIKKRINNL